MFMHSSLFSLFSNYHQNSTECNILDILGFKNMEKLPIIIKKNLSLPFASRKSVLISRFFALASNFFQSLALASKVVSSTPPLQATMSTKALGKMDPILAQSAPKVYFGF